MRLYLALALNCEFNYEKESYTIMYVKLYMYLRTNGTIKVTTTRHSLYCASP